MPADLGTKPLPGPRIKFLQDLIGMWLSSPDDEKEADDDAVDVPDLQKGEVKNQSLNLATKVLSLANKVLSLAIKVLGLANQVLMLANKVSSLAII